MDQLGQKVTGRREREGEERKEEGERDDEVETESLLMNKMTVAHGDHLHAGKSEASAL